MSFIEQIVKPLIDDAYQKGFSAGVSAQMLKEKKELNDRELYLYEYGYKMGAADTIAENGIVEISAKEFDDLTGGPAEPEQPAEPFGFVGTIDDISLVLDEEAV